MKYGCKPATQVIGKKFAPNMLQRAISRIVSRVMETASYSYEPSFDAVDDQSQYGTCVANSSAELFEFFMSRRTGNTTQVSRRAIYRQAKADYEAHDMTDDGMQVWMGLKLCQTRGYIPESAVPYPPDGREDLLLAPVPNLWNSFFKLQGFVAVAPNVTTMKMALRKHGPIILGTLFANEWQQPLSDGTLPHPLTPGGGHCMVIVGYDDARQAFRVRNSWGAQWGDGGYCWLPYSFASTAFWPTDLYTIIA